METTTYWHVTTDDYDGGDLLSYDEQEARNGEPPTWKWEGDEPFDTDVVCLFATRAEAEQFVADGYGTTILRVDLPDDVTTVRVHEGYVAVPRLIPAEYIMREPASPPRTSARQP